MSENQQNDVNQTEQSQDGDANTTTLLKERGENNKNIAAVIILASFFLLVADLIAATVFLVKGIYVGAIVCAALFVGGILAGIIVAIIDHKMTMRNDIRTAKKITEGKVLRCITSSMTTYDVTISADGAEYVVSSKQSYEPDETVKVAIMNKKRTIIVTEKDLEKLNEPIFTNAPMHRRHHPRHRH